MSDEKFIFENCKSNEDFEVWPTLEGFVTPNFCKFVHQNQFSSVVICIDMHQYLGEILTNANL